MSHPPSRTAVRSTMSYAPPLQQGQSTTSYPAPSYLPPLHQGQSFMSYQIPMPQAQGSMPYPLTMLPDQTNQLLQYPQVQAQATMSTLPQTQSSQVASLQASQRLPTPFITPSAESRTTVSSLGPPFVYGIRIPGDGSRIERMLVEIVIDQHKPTDHVPLLKGWWPETDPTAHPMVGTLKSQVPPSRKQN